MEIHGGGRTLFNREVVIGALPEAPPSVASDGASMLLEAKLGGGVIPPYVLVLVDLVGGTSPTVTLDAYLQFPYAKFLSNWQLIKRNILSDDYSQAFTFMLVPTMGAARISVRVQAVTGSPTTVRLHGRAINDDQAYQLLELQGGSSSSITLSDIPPLDVTEAAASAGTATEASRQDHKHSIDYAEAEQSDAICLNTDIIGDLVYIRADRSGSKYVVEAADPSDFSKMPAIGMIISKTTATDCVIQFRGRIIGLYGSMTPGSMQFVGDDGRLTATPPAPIGSQRKFSQVMGVALGANVIGLEPDLTLTRRRA